jgi:alkyl sulfatase BDS1-like metallo-beta-lactamase superfamily hydrolase
LAPTRELGIPIDLGSSLDPQLRARSMTHDLIDFAERMWTGQMPTSSYPLMEVGIGGAVAQVVERTGLVGGFGNVSAFVTDEGLFLVDSGGQGQAEAIHRFVRAWSRERLHTAVYTHGHRDHVFGVPYFEREGQRATVVAHEAVPARFDRYMTMARYERLINRRQYRRLRTTRHSGGAPAGEYRFPDRTYLDAMELEVGGERFELYHARGETDDATWVWAPGRGVLCSGDLIMWATPNAGNPQKVQRYAKEWAVALRQMAGLDAEILLPGHGPPVFGTDRVRQILSDTASLLESLHDQTIELMNDGAPLNRIIHEVRAPQELLARPYLNPLADDPEFVVRNVWRLYGGWYDGNPANLLPARDEELAAEMASLVGGTARLVARARELSQAGDLRLASHLIELAYVADPSDPEVGRERADIYDRRAAVEPSITAKGIFSSAAREARGEDVVAAGTMSGKGRLARIVRSLRGS